MCVSLLAKCIELLCSFFVEANYNMPFDSSVLVSGRRALVKSEKECMPRASYAALVEGKWAYFADDNTSVEKNEQFLNEKATHYLSALFVGPSDKLVLKADDGAIPRTFKLFDAGMVLMASESGHGHILWGVSLVRDPPLCDSIMARYGFRRVDLSLEAQGLTDYTKAFEQLFYASCAPDAPNALYSYASHTSLRFFITCVSTELLAKSVVGSPTAGKHSIPAFLRSTHEVPMYTGLKLSDKDELEMLARSIYALHGEFKQQPRSHHLFIDACNDPDVLTRFVNDALSTFGNITDKKLDAENAALQKAFADIRAIAMTNVRMFFSRGLDTMHAVEADLMCTALVDGFTPQLEELVAGATIEEKQATAEKLTEFITKNEYSSKPSVFSTAQRIHATLVFGMLSEPRVYIPLVREWKDVESPPKEITPDETVPHFTLPTNMLKKVIDYTHTIEEMSDLTKVFKILHQLLVTAQHALDPDGAKIPSIDEMVEIMLSQKTEEEEDK